MYLELKYISIHPFLRQIIPGEETINSPGPHYYKAHAWKHNKRLGRKVYLLQTSLIVQLVSYLKYHTMDSRGYNNGSLTFCFTRWH